MRDNRPETGAMQFGSDWPGAFIRGDDAFAFAEAIARVLDSKAAALDQACLRELHKVLRDTNGAQGGDVQKLAPFMECDEDETGMATRTKQAHRAAQSSSSASHRFIEYDEDDEDE